MDKIGYVPVKGTINGYPFKSTLVSIENSVFRLYANIDMRRGKKIMVKAIASKVQVASNFDIIARFK